ncbi:MAG: PqqD family protein [Marinosulfonomonas sp.]|nr:PqqD family protein [Marinosulfonomonas sp.]
MPDTSYKVSSADIVFEEFDGDLVVLNLASGQYFGLNSPAAAIWTSLVSGVCPADIANAGPKAKAVNKFVEDLLSFELIFPAPDAKATLKPGEIAALRAIGPEPLIEVYDDLADLIVADPIHDVDQEAGWPNLPTSE